MDSMNQGEATPARRRVADWVEWQIAREVLRRGRIAAALLLAGSLANRSTNEFAGDTPVRKRTG